jgi:hypothetical protein
MYMVCQGRRMSDKVGQIRHTAKHAIVLAELSLAVLRSRRKLLTLTFRALQLSQALRSRVFGSEGVCGEAGAGA